MIVIVIVFLCNGNRPVDVIRHPGDAEADSISRFWPIAMNVHLRATRQTYYIY